MDASQVDFDVSPSNGAATRLVIVRAGKEETFRDRLDVNRAKAREQFGKSLAELLRIDPAPLIARCHSELPRLADAADRVAAEQAATAAAQSDGLDGRMVVLRWPEPWPEPVTLAEVLDEVRQAIRRYVVLKPEAAVAVTLWTAWTYVYDCGRIAPMLAITSPSKRCGKTTLLSILRHLVARPLPTSNCGPASLFRVVEQFGPLTLLIDECDSFAKGDEQLRGLLNSGHTKDLAFVLRAVPKPDGSYEVRRFSTWAAKAVAAIGNLPSTWADRAIAIRLERKHRSETVERLTPQAVAYLETLARKLFTSVVTDEVKQAVATGDPTIPDSLHDRAADNWRPLLCIADAAGGHWPTTARQAAVVLSGGEEADTEDLAVRLLLDSLAVFDSDTELSARTLAERLAQLEESPWPTYRYGKPISADQTGRLLRRFGIKPRKTRSGNVYRRTDVEAAATRYSPTPPDPSSTSSTLDANPCGVSTYGVELSESPSSTFHPSSTHVNPYSTSTYDEGGTSGTRKPPIPENIEQWVF